ncbi:hypothetical protein YPPY99_3120, partial [Yersinia pestis PY-99]
MWRGD